MNGTCEYCELWGKCWVSKSGGSCGCFREEKNKNIDDKKNNERR